MSPNPVWPVSLQKTGNSTHTHKGASHGNLKTAICKPVIEAWNLIFPSQPSEGPSPASTLISDSELPNCEMIHFCCFKSSSYGSPDKLIHIWLMFCIFPHAHRSSLYCLVRCLFRPLAHFVNWIHFLVVEFEFFSLFRLPVLYHICVF